MDHRLRLFGFRNNPKDIVQEAMGKRMRVGDFPRVGHSVMVYLDALRLKNSVFDDIKMS